MSGEMRGGCGLRTTNAWLYSIWWCSVDVRQNVMKFTVHQKVHEKFTKMYYWTKNTFLVFHWWKFVRRKILKKKFSFVCCVCLCCCLLAGMGGRRCR